MIIIGVAPKIAIPTFIYILIVIFIDYILKPAFIITQNNNTTLMMLGILLIIPGIIIVISVAKKLRKSFSANTLMTEGLYKIVRNPMYTSYLILIIPGICFLFNSWLVLTPVIFNYILMQIFIKEEYKYLEEKFGEEYKIYLSKVRIKFL